MTRRTTLPLVLCLLIAAPLLAQPTLEISLGIRETGSTVAIGADGGSSGSLEWVNLDGQTLTLDGTWQTFTFDMDMATITAFTGDGILDGTAGTIEHIRIKNAGGITLPITLFIDDVTDTTTSQGGINFGDFEGFLANDEVLFQEPGFSGSTGGNLITPPNFSGVDTTVAQFGTNSCRVEFQFLDGATTRWVRLTTFGALNLPNPTIAFNDDSVVSFSIMGMVPTIPFDHTITCVPNATNPMDSDVLVDILGGTPSGVVYLAMTVNNVGSAPSGWFWGIDITLQEIQAQITVGNPWIDVLDASGSFSISLPIPGTPCPLGIGIDAVPVEFLPVTGVLSQAGPAQTWNL